ncbi:hypothetical protein BC835DRAFT_1383705 [Cytidiella melzeri]|nr:hypothetical protein BC835DRAFT_1383705 [Cytidiella melzeri]
MRSFAIVALVLLAGVGPALFVPLVSCDGADIACPAANVTAAGIKRERSPILARQIEVVPPTHTKVDKQETTVALVSKISTLASTVFAIPGILWQNAYTAKHSSHSFPNASNSTDPKKSPSNPIKNTTDTQTNSTTYRREDLGEDGAGYLSHIAHFFAGFSSRSVLFSPWVLPALTLRTIEMILVNSRRSTLGITASTTETTYSIPVHILSVYCVF